MKKQLLKKNLLILFIALVTGGLNAQNWTWMKGNNSLDNPGVYGTINVPAATNNPGAREAAFQWKDASGNFWIFGGAGFDGSGSNDFLNDLWRYNPTTNQWTWVSGSNSGGNAGVYGTLGVAAASNIPGGRAGGVSWADNSGNLWLFGGLGYDASGINDDLNDLWRYNIASNQWTWMGGSNSVIQNGNYGTLSVPAAANVPGARRLSSGWKDNSGNFWLFGGLGYDNASSFPSFLNDLWRYNPSTNQWTWMHGSNTADMLGIYGTMGTPASANIPGSRFGQSGVTDAAGNLWLFGGFGWDNTGFSAGDYNDLWRYNVATNQWTWIRGSSAIDQNGVYGTLGVQAGTNEPGSREQQAMWADATGNLWIFGGFAFDNISPFSDLSNDLWRYNITANQWTWVKGSNTQLDPGTYGTQGVAAPANNPGARSLANSFVDNANNLWLFGGFAFDGSFTGEADDLWKLSNCTAAPLVVTVNPLVACAGVTKTISVSGATSYTWSTSQQTNAIVVNTSSNTTYTVNSTDASGCNNSAMVTSSVNPNPTVTISGNTSSICVGAIATLTASGAVNYTWTNLNNTATTTLSPTSNTVIGVLGADANSCTNTATYSLTVNALPSITLTTTKGQICAGESATLTATSAGSYSWHTTATNTNNVLVIKPASTATFVVSVTNAAGCKSSSSITQSVNACIGIDENFIPVTMKLYPNPARNHINISVTEAGHGNALSVYNSVGQLVFSKPLESTSERIELELPKGFYNCVLRKNGEALSQTKLVIE